MGMRFAAPYQLNGCTIDYDNIDEFNIVFTKDSKYDELKKFIELYPNHRINIQYQDGYDIEQMFAFFQENEQLYWRMRSNDLPYVRECQENNIKFFFDNNMPIYSYCLLEWALNSGTTGIYIADDLTYNIKNVYEQCNEKGIELRVVLNRVPITNSLSLTCPSVQVYRPQDFDYLNDYYAVGEFNCGDEYDWVKAEVLYRRWYIDHFWEDDLDLMNPELRLPYPTASIPPELTRFRSVCQHRCTMRTENVCSKCRRLLLMGYLNADRNLIYKDNDNGLPPLDDIVDSIIVSKDNNK